MGKPGAPSGQRFRLFLIGACGVQHIVVIDFVDGAEVDGDRGADKYPISFSSVFPGAHESDVEFVFARHIPDPAFCFTWNLAITETFRSILRSGLQGARYPYRTDFPSSKFMNPLLVSLTFTGTELLNSIGPRACSCFWITKPVEALSIQYGIEAGASNSQSQQVCLCCGGGMSGQDQHQKKANERADQDEDPKNPLFPAPDSKDFGVRGATPSGGMDATRNLSELTETP